MHGSRSSLACLIVVATAFSGSAIFAADALCSAALVSTLSKWRTAVSELNRFEVCGHRRIYNDVFEVEERARFVIQCETPRSLRIDFQPITISPEETSRRINRKTGQSFALRATEPGIWLWRENEFLLLRPGTGKVDFLNDATVKSFHAAIQPQAQATDPQAVDDLGAYGPASLLTECSHQLSLQFAYGFWLIFMHKNALPSLFMADDPGFTKNIEWSIARLKNGTIRLDGRPILKMNCYAFQSLSIILDANTGRPLAQKTVDPSGILETVYVFESWNENPKSLSFDIDLRRYDGEHIPLPPDIQLLPRRGAAKR